MFKDWQSKPISVIRKTRVNQRQRETGAHRGEANANQAYDCQRAVRDSTLGRMTTGPVTRSCWSIPCGYGEVTTGHIITDVERLHGPMKCISRLLCATITMDEPAIVTPLSRSVLPS